MAKIIFRWDLDKTYLKTEFDRASDLVKTFLQPANEKKTFAGARALILALSSVHESSLTFVSGSPRQMRKKLLEKLALDGIQVDELVLKPNFSNAIRGRFRALREQVGYKLPALLRMRHQAPKQAQEICFGDDAEADAFVYCLYDAAARGQVTLETLQAVMKKAGAYNDQIRDACKWTEKLQLQELPEPLVRRVFIHLEGKSRPSRFKVFDQRVVAIYNYFQAGVVLYADGLLTESQIDELALNMMQEGGYDALRLANSFQDIVRRLHLPVAKMNTLFNGTVPESQSLLVDFWSLCQRRLSQLDASGFDARQEPHGAVDFMALIEAGALKRKKKRIGPPDPALAFDWLEDLIDDT